MEWILGYHKGVNERSGARFLIRVDLLLFPDLKNEITYL
jgi:hypothetical protein